MSGEDQSSAVAAESPFNIAKIDINWTISWVIGGFGIVSTVFTVCASNDVKFWLLGLYIIILAGCIIYREKKFSDTASLYSKRIKDLHRQARFAEKYTHSLKDQHRCAHNIRDAYIHIKNGNKAAAHGKIEEGLSNLANAFKFITGQNCRACIKLIIDIKSKKVAKRFHTITLCRSENIGVKEQNNIPKKLSENTDFLLLFDKEENVFFQNNLLELLTYQNSSWPSGLDERKDYIKNKKYDYASTIVWPIRNITAPDAEPAVIAFLCVDCKAVDVFDEERDVDYGAVIGDLLYPVLSAYRELTLKIDDNTSGENDGS